VENDTEPTGISLHNAAGATDVISLFVFVRIFAGNIGSGRLSDTDKYFVVAIEALGNGVSSA
jgi:homoserine acetyltransferase